MPRKPGDCHPPSQSPLGTLLRRSKYATIHILLPSGTTPRVPQRRCTQEVYPEKLRTSRDCYGYRGVLLDLRSQGWVIIYNLVSKHMHEMGLRPKIRQGSR